MKIRRSMLKVLICAASVVPVSLPTALSAQTPDSATQPDNSKVNKRDRNADQPTADQQKVDKSDRELTRSIRKSIMADKSLSTYAHNVKIISQNGSVTLKGPVKSQDEKTAIIAKAVEVVGSKDKVTDQVSVKP